jgi:hypothetical protein
MYDIIEGIKLQYMEQKIIMNEEILKKLGYNTIALEMLLKREAQINTDGLKPEDIILPGQNRNINNQDQTQVSLDNIHKQFISLSQAIKSLPNEHNGDDYFGTLKKRLVSSLFDVGLKIGSLMTQTGMSEDELSDFINDEL